MKRSVREFSRTLLLACVAVVGVQVSIDGAHGVVIPPTTHDGVMVWTGSDPAELDAAQILAFVGNPGLASLFYDAGFGKARIATNAGSDATALDRQVVFTAIQNGIAGHDITVALLNPGVANSPLSVSVNGRAITVTLATDGSGTPASTAAQVVAAVNATPAVGSLVVASAGGSGAGVVETLSLTPLAPVIVEAGSFAASYQTVFSDSASFPQDASIAYGSGAPITASSLYLYVRDTGQVPAFYIYDLLAYSWNGLEEVLLADFWPGPGAIEQLKIVASTSTPVPEGSSLALLALGLAALAWSRRPRRR